MYGETSRFGSIPCGQDSGFGSDSEHLRFVYYDQHSTTSYRQLTCLSRQPTITKNLSFIPFDIFLTAGSLTLMTYIMTQASESTTEPPEHTGKKFVNIPKNDPEHIEPQMPELVTARELLSTSSGEGFLTLEGLSSPSRGHARQALGDTVVRQPGRRGVGGGLLQPLLFLQLTQPSTLLSCHQRRQRLELSLFDLTLKGVASDYVYLGRLPYFLLAFQSNELLSFSDLGLSLSPQLSFPATNAGSGSECLLWASFLNPDLCFLTSRLPLRSSVVTE